MNDKISILMVAFLLMTISSFGQQISETNFAIGISRTASAEFKHIYDEPLPTYLILSGSKSWYSTAHRITLRKEAGLNLQYARIDVNNGGKGASNHYTGSIISLFAGASLQARLRISEAFAFGIGPEAEILLIGNSNLNNEYYSMMVKPYIHGNKEMGGFNRDHFNKPSLGIKASLYESNPESRVNVGLNLSYLWTDSDPSNFYADRFTRFSIVIGFKKQKEKEVEEAIQ